MLLGSCGGRNPKIRFISMNPAPSPIPEETPELRFLRELVEIESPSFDAEASERIASLITDRFRAIGGAVNATRTEAGVNLTIDFPGPGSPLLLVGHTDTVWPAGTLAGPLPWSHQDGIVRGPGAFDMKAGIVVMHAALARLNGRPARATRIVLTCDEEIGSPTSLGLLREHAAIAGGALGFESPHPDGALKVGRRGSTRLLLSVAGKPAHAALDPDKGISAIDELLDHLIRVREIVGDHALPSPVLCNIGTITGGTRANVVPEHAAAEIGLRFLDGDAEARVLGQIRGLTSVRSGAALTVKTLSSRPAWAPTPGDEALLAELAAAAPPGQSITGRPAAGAGDTNLLGSLGLPTLDGLGPRGGGAHALDEHLRVDSLEERIDLLCALLSTAIS